MDKLTFTTNWNNKLDCDSFTTLRLKSGRYSLGKRFEVFLKGHHKKNIEIKEITSLTLERINNYIAYLDTGYNRDECIKTIKAIYKNKNIDWSKQEIYFMLCVTLKN